jgi:hypothetical protein
MKQTTMRAKLLVQSVAIQKDDKDQTVLEAVRFCGVTKSDGYDELGLDEDNTYAKYSPDAEFKVTILNPALFGKFQYGQKYYVDFIPAE